MKHILWVIGLATLAPTIFYFVKYLEATPGTARNSLALAGVFFVVSLVFWAIFFFKRFREEGQQDISITKY